MEKTNVIDQIIKENSSKFYDRIKNDDNFVVDGEKITKKGDFFQKQTRIALKNYGIIDPESIEEYIVMGGYKALEKSIFET